MNNSHPSIADMKRRRVLNALGAIVATPLVLPLSVHAAPRRMRIASLSWAGAQILVSVGLPPLGITELDSYPEVGATPPMPPGTLELGTRSEPNLELLAQLKPDLIVIDQDQSRLEAQLRTIAPVASIDIYNPERGKPYARAVEETRRLSALVGHAPQARAYLDQVDAHLTACARRVATFEVPPVLLVDLYDDGRHLFVYGPNSMIDDVMQRLNVRNAWQRATESGYVLLNIEDLASFGNTQMFYISHGVRDQIALRNLARSLLWRHMPFVAAGRFRPLPGFYTYGAASCATQFASALTDGLEAMHRANRATEAGRV